jgi:hypothetical protein
METSTCDSIVIKEPSLDTKSLFSQLSMRFKKEKKVEWGRNVLEKKKHSPFTLPTHSTQHPLWLIFLSTASATPPH